MGLTARAHRHLDYDKAAQAIFTDPEIAEVGVAEAEAFAAGRKLRVTKVPFSANPKSLINGDTRGFVKILSDPATGVVLGGAIVGPQRGRADLGDRGRGHQPPEGRRHRRLVARAPGAGRVAGRSCVLTPCARSSPAPPGSSAATSRRRCWRVVTRSSASTASRRTTTAPTKEQNLARARGDTDHFEFVEADLRTCDIEALLERRRRRVPPGRAGRACGSRGRTGSPTTSGHNVLATQRLLEARAARAARGARRATRRRRRCTATSRVTRPWRPTCPSRSARTASRSSRPSTCAACTRRTRACTPCRCGTSPCSARGNGPTCRSTGCARPRSHGAQFPRYGDGTQIREFTYVGDIVAGNLAAADADVAARHVREPRRRRRDHAQRPDRARRRPRGRAGRDRSAARRWPGDSFRNGGAIDRARELLGWEPHVSLRDGIAAQLAWHRCGARVGGSARDGRRARLAAR